MFLPSGRKSTWAISFLACGAVLLAIFPTPAYAGESDHVGAVDQTMQEVLPIENDDNEGSDATVEELPVRDPAPELALDEGSTDSDPNIPNFAAGSDDPIGDDPAVIADKVVPDDESDGAPPADKVVPDDEEAPQEVGEGLPPTVMRLGATATSADPADAQTLDGVDISGWNTKITDYSALGDFVIIKATEYNPNKKSYTTYNDYESQADAALKAGKLIGFYHLATSKEYSGQTWDQQAKGFIDAVARYVGQAVLFLGWEDSYTYDPSSHKDVCYSKVESDVNGAKAWLDYVYDNTGIKPMIYMNKNCVNSYNWSSVANAGYDLWGAEHLYENDETYEGNSFTGFIDPGSTSQWGAWGKPTIYQYSSTASFPQTGNGGRYDVNVFYGTKDDWIMRCSAKELPDVDASEALEDDAVYSFASLPSSTVVIVSSAGNAQLGSSNYLTAYWRVSNLGGGFYSFTNVGDGRALSFADSASKGTNVDLTSALTTWRIIRCTNGSLALVPRGFNDLRLDILGGKTAVLGTNLQLYTANGTAAQRFFLIKSKSLSEAYKTKSSVASDYYVIASGIDSTKVLDIKGASTTNGGNVQIYSSNGTSAQSFLLENKSNGLYTIRNVKSGKYLDVTGGKKTSGANVQQYQSNNTLAQLWYLRKSGSGWVICSAASGLALDVTGGRSANGTNVQIYGANGTKAQTFFLKRDAPLSDAISLVTSGVLFDDGYYSLLSGVGAGMVVDVVGDSSANGANVQIYRSNGTLTQKFKIAYTGNGFYTIQCLRSGKYLDAKGAGKTNGTNVHQYQGNGTRAQLWYFVPTGGRYVIKNAASGLALDVAGGKPYNGTNVQLYSPNGTSAQSFDVRPASLIADGTYALASALNPIVLVLDVKGGSVKAGAALQGYQPNGTKSQLFDITFEGDGTYTIRNTKSGLVIGVTGTSNDSLTQLDGNDAMMRRWRIIITDSGLYSLVNAGTGKALDVSGAKLKSGVAVQQYAVNGTKAQGWVFIPQEKSTPGGRLGKFIGNMIYYTELINVGYSQGTHRYDLWDGGQTDCSALVITCLKKAGFEVGKANSTHDMRSNLVANGWNVLSWSINAVRPGDILLCDGYHTCAVVSGFGKSGQIAEAWINELGTIIGGKAGDQTGKETRVRPVYQCPYGGGWKCILRYTK